ncbi:MAG: tetratricopeptide repeat protein [Caulobacteraceae bacterium]
MIKGESVNGQRRIELIIKILLWVIVVAVSLIQRSDSFEALPQYMKIFIFLFDIALSIMLIWFMPSSKADRTLKRGLKYLDKDSDKAVRYLNAYLDSEMLTDLEIVAGLRILGIANHKRGDNEKAIQYLEAALEEQEKDNDTKVELLGAIGIVYSESGEYKKAVEYFDFPCPRHISKEMHWFRSWKHI